MILGTAVPAGTFVFWPELTTEDFSFTAEELTAIEFPPEIGIPPPPAGMSRPATPIMATADIDNEITIAPTISETNSVEAPPPPPTLTEVVDLAAAPTFTPFTVAPDIINRDEVIAALKKAYPPLLKEAGIGGEVRVFLFIDETGSVQTTRIGPSSGHQQFDDAALAVASLYQFSPALNRDEIVAV
jgi:TonB family protein